MCTSVRDTIAGTRGVRFLESKYYELTKANCTGRQLSAPFRRCPSQLGQLGVINRKQKHNMANLSLTLIALKKQVFVQKQKKEFGKVEQKNVSKSSVFYVQCTTLHSWCDSLQSIQRIPTAMGQFLTQTKKTKIRYFGGISITECTLVATKNKF